MKNQDNPAVPTGFDARDARKLVSRKKSAGCIAWMKMAVVAGVALLAAVTTVVPVKTFAALSLPWARSTKSIPGWGDVINPDEDCTLTVTNGTLTVALPGTDHAMMPERGRMNAPRVMREVTGDFDVQVKVSGDFPPGAKSVARGRRPYQDAGLLLWLDAKNNLKLARARIVVEGKSVDYFNLEMRQDGTCEAIQGAFAKETRRLMQAGPVYLRLQLRRDVVIAALSADGTAWVTESLPIGDVPKKLRVGMIAENNTSSPLTVVFEEFTVSHVAGK